MASHNENGVWRIMLLGIVAPILIVFLGWAWTSQDARIARAEDTQANHKVAITNQEARLEFLEREYKEIRSDLKELLSRVPKR